MSKLIVLVLAAVVATLSFATAKDLQVEARVEIVEDIELYKAAHPELELVPMKRTINAQQQFVYTLGNRVTGDRQVASSGNNQSWPTLQDVVLTLNYPASGTGSVLSFVQVVVSQSSPYGQGFVTAGGIGYRYITVVIEAQATTHFNYSAAFYGI